MNRVAVRLIAHGGLALIALLIAAPQSHAQTAAPSYPRMAPLNQYLMDRDAEIALARSAAPGSISRDATVLVLGRHGYETAVEGKNGFVCLVERGWGAPFDWPQYWNPKIRAAICLNPAAAQSILPICREETRLLLADRSKAEVIDAIKASFARRELHPVGPGAMCYMMGKGSYLTDAGTHNLSHLMFFTASDAATWGANLPGSPVIGASLWFYSPHRNQLKGLPAINVYIVGVGKWSDGTSAR